jgi:uncharacterized protein with HEPN domain
MTEEGLKYLSDIKKAIELIEDFTSSITNYNEYLDDKKTQSAVERQSDKGGPQIQRTESTEDR